jgi:hypothetical protein
MIGTPFETLIQQFITESCTEEEAIAYEIIRSERMTLLDQDKITPQFLAILYLPLTRPFMRKYTRQYDKYLSLYGNHEHTRFLGRDQAGNFVDINFKLNDVEEEFVRNNQDKQNTDGLIHSESPFKDIPGSSDFYPYSITLDDNRVISGYISATHIMDSSSTPAYESLR